MPAKKSEKSDKQQTPVTILKRKRGAEVSSVCGNAQKKRCKSKKNKSGISDSAEKKSLTTRNDGNGVVSGDARKTGSLYTRRSRRRHSKILDTDGNTSSDVNSAASLTSSGEERRACDQQIKEPDIATAIKEQLYPEDQPKASGFKALSSLLKECMLEHRWDEANEILSAMCQHQSEETDYQWKCGMEIMQHHPNGSPEIIENLLSVMTKVRLISQHKIQLENAIYLLSENRVQDAYNILTKKLSSSVGLRMNPPIQMDGVWKELSVAYTGLLDYYLWKQSEAQAQDEQQVTESREMANRDKWAMPNLSKICKKPGVWDIFITRQVEILEHQGEISKATELLEEYCVQNPTNPNAHIYLFNFIKHHLRHDTRKMREILKKIVGILPADVHTLEYVSLLEELEMATAKTVLPVLFDMADYSTCHTNVALWKQLVKHVFQVVKRQEQHEKILLRKCWKDRESWWPSFHFSKTQVLSLVKNHYKVALHKAILASVFLGSGHPFVVKVHCYLETTHPKSACRLSRTMQLFSNPFC